jgi:hypothetical protein
MSFNRIQLQKDTKELTKAKAPAKSKDVIYDPKDQWNEFEQVSNFPEINYATEYSQMQNGGENIPIIEDAGSFNEEGFWIPDWETMKQQAKELNAKTVKTKNGAMIYFDDNWNVQSVDDNPQMKSGGSKSKHVVVKQSKIPGANKGLFSNQKFKRGEPIGLAHEDGQPVGDIGNMHNHSDNPNMYSVKVGNKRYVYAKRNIEPGEELTTDYRLQPELEQPEDFMKRGGSTKGLVRMPKPSKKGLASKAYSRSLEATNRLFTENRLFEKPKDRKRKVFDPNAKYYASGGEYGMPLGAGVSQNFIGNRDNFKVGGIPELPLRDNRVNYNAFVNGFEPMTKRQDGGITDAMNAMMKARLAYANEFGNPAAQRMINLPDNPYQFDDGNTGTHYMASMDNYAVPQIQDINGQLMLGDYGPESNEAIQFDRPEDAEYFAEHYKDVSPGFIEAELTDDEIEEYRKGGYIVEDISIPSLNTYQDGGVYTFSERPDSKYKKDSKGNWLVSNAGTKNKYVPVKDPSGSRTKTLNKWAESQDLSNEAESSMSAYNKQRSNQLKDFESGIDFSAQPSETLNKVSGDYLGNFGMKSKNLFTDAQNKKAVLKNERKKDELVAHHQNTARQVLNAKNLSTDQKKKLLSNPQAMNQLAAEYYDYKVAPSERNGSVMNTMGMSQSYHQEKSPFRVLPYEEKTVDISKLTDPINSSFEKLGLKTPSSILPTNNKKLTLGPSKLSSWKGIGEAPKNAPSDAVNMLDEYYVSGLLGGLALPEMYGVTGSLSKYAPIKSIPGLNLGNVVTAKGVYDAGTEYIPNSVAAYNRAQDEGWTLKNQADLVYNALKAGLSFVPLSNTLKEAKAVKNIKNAFSTGEYGVKLAKNPYDPLTHYKAIRAFGTLAGARQTGGETNYFDTELTDAEIQDLIDEGYIVEQL